MLCRFLTLVFDDVPYTIHLKSVCPCPTSNVRPLGRDWGLPCTRSSAHWYAFGWRCKSHQSLRNFVGSSTDSRGSMNPGTGCSLMYDFAFMGQKCETILCFPLLYGINFLLQISLYGVQGPATEIGHQVVNKEWSEAVPGNTRWQLLDRWWIYFDIESLFQSISQTSEHGKLWYAQVIFNNDRWVDNPIY